MSIKEVTTTEDLEELISEVSQAQAEFANYSQEEVDDIFRRASVAANDKRIDLAKLAVADTEMGVV
ncbi:MAG: hypothetical protein ACQEP9_10510, partial [Bacillota bacterium]